MGAPATQNYTPLSRPDYFTDLAEQLVKLGHGDKAALACMTYDPAGTELETLTEALCQAVGQGAYVSFSCDAINFLVTDDARFGPLFFRGSISGPLIQPFKRIHKALERMRQAGGDVKVINQPTHRFSIPIAGRSHIKFALLNNMIYIGGCNFDYPMHDDVMLRWEDTTTATWLHSVAAKIIQRGSIQSALGITDLRHVIAPDADLLIDVGVRNQSIIMDQAIELIDQAEEHIYLTTQYFPTHSTARHLRRALDRGVKLKIIYNNVANSHAPKFVHYINFWLQQRRLPADFFVHELPKTASYIHAKLLVTEKAILAGSHNYVTPGVRLGTAEIALIKHDAVFAQNVRKWCDEQLLAGSTKHKRPPVDTAR